MTARHPRARVLSRAGCPGGWRLGLAAVVLLSSCLVAGSPALAAEPPVKLSLRPIGAAGAYFDLTLRPGETRTLAVELANLGEAPIGARSYAADVYTIINGGFGARLRDDPTTGTTTWLGFPSSVSTLAPGSAITRSFTISVPADAAPGEYVTSIILENDVPIQGSGSVTLNQIVRQAMAVVITVPGPRVPGLAIGAASHKVVADKSSVAVAVENTGNVRLKPVADLVLSDAAGAEVRTAQVPMDSFYAHTATQIEVPLSALLQPGHYTVRLVLADAAANVRAENDAIPLEVVAVPSPAVAGAASAGAESNGSPSAGSAAGGIPIAPEVVQAIRDTRVPVVVGVGVVAGGLLLGVLVGLLILALARRRQRRRAGDRGG